MTSERTNQTARNGLPRSYRDQRKLEREALRARQEQTRRRQKLPTACGFVYKPRRPKNPSPAWSDEPVTCMRNAGSGTDHHGKGFCDYHEALAAREASNVISDKNRTLGAIRRRSTFFGDPQETDPQKAIMDELARTVTIIAFMENRMAELKKHGESEDDIMTQFVMKEGVKPSVWMTMLMEERKHLVATATAAIKAGIAERQVRIAEDQGRMFAAVLLALIHDSELGLSPTQLQIAPSRIRHHMAGLLMQSNTGGQLDPAEVLTDAQMPRTVIEARVKE